MTIGNHPAGRSLGPPTCAATGCPEPARARVAWPQVGHAPRGFAIVRPLSNPHGFGQFLCLDHAHTAVDEMLLRATPEPTR